MQENYERAFVDSELLGHKCSYSVTFDIKSILNMFQMVQGFRIRRGKYKVCDPNKLASV